MSFFYNFRALKFLAMGIWKSYFLIFPLVLLLNFQVRSQEIVENKEFFYIGTFSENGSLGIYVYDYKRKTHRFDLVQTIISRKSPSFLAISPDGKYLVSSNRGSVKNDTSYGSLSSFAIDQSTGKLSLIHNQKSYGESPCHVSFHPEGKHLFVSHYKSGNFAVFPYDSAGIIGEPIENIQFEGKGTDMSRQDRPHPHSAIPSSDGRYVYVSDLGLDKIFIYNFDADSGKVSPGEVPFVEAVAGGGPRHLTFNPKGTLAFSSEEISSTICSYKVDKKTGALERVQRLSALPIAFYGSNTSADIHTSPDGRYVYISNRGYNGLGMYKVTNNGGLKNIGFMPTIGTRPRSFLPEPHGLFMLVANRDSNEINIFVMENDGKLSDTSGYLPVPSPVCIKYLEIIPEVEKVKVKEKEKEKGKEKEKEG